MALGYEHIMGSKRALNAVQVYLHNNPLCQELDRNTYLAIGRDWKTIRLWNLLLKDLMNKGAQLGRTGGSHGLLGTAVFCRPADGHQSALISGAPGIQWPSCGGTRGQTVGNGRQSMAPYSAAH